MTIQNSGISEHFRYLIGEAKRILVTTRRSNSVSIILVVP